MKEGLSAQDHAVSLLASMNLQRKQVQFCDCVIKKGQGQVYPVHRCILAASSPVLASILSSTGALVEMEAPCFVDPILGLLFDYIYTGILPHLDHEHYSYLLAAAQYLEMDELQHALRTKSNVLEYHNTSGISKSTIYTKLTFLQPNTDCYVNDAAESPHSGCQMDSPGMHLSSSAEEHAISRMDGVCMRSGTDASLGDAIINTSEMTVHNFSIPKIGPPSHNLIQSIGSSGKTQQMSTVCQDRKKDQSAGTIERESWQESNEEDDPRSYSSDLTEVQKNENIIVEKTQNEVKVKADEMQSDYREIKNHNFHSCSTSVIRHSSSATRIHVAEPHYTGSHTTKEPLSEGTSYNDIVKDMKAQNQHYPSQVSDSTGMSDQEYNSSSTSLTQNNEQMDNDHSNDTYYFDSEDESNKVVQSRSDHSFDDFSLIKDKTQVQNVTEEKSNLRIRFNGLCAKRKLKEEHSDGFSKSAKNVSPCNPGSKTDLVYSSASTTAEKDNVTDSSSVYKGPEYRNTWSNQNQKLRRSLSIPPEGNTCQAAYSDQSYSGHLYYHWESHDDTDSPSHIPFNPTLQLTPDFSPNYSGESSEDNNVPLFGVSNLCEPSATITNGQIVLLDISTKSPEMLVSYKHTFEMERTCGLGNENMMKNDSDSLDTGVSQIDEVEYQEGNVRLGASSCKQRGTILTSSWTSCTSACAKDCARNSMSSHLSDHIPSSSMQTNLSDLLPSPVRHAFQCSMCERSFSQRGSLNRHVRSHLGVRPFPCPQCPMTFSRQYRVTEHMRVHQRSALGTDFSKLPASSV